MLSLFHSLVRPRGVLSVVAARCRRNLILCSQAACEQALVNSTPPQPTTSGRLTRRAIFSTRSMEDLNTIIQPSLSSMRPQRLIDCMYHSMNLAESQLDGLSIEDDPSFKVLAGTVLTRIRFFTADDNVKLARIAGELKLDCSSSLVQGIYQMLRKQLNDLDIGQIIGVQRSLQGLQGTSELTDAMRVSLPQVFDIQVERQLDETDMQMCLKSLQYVASTKTKVETREFVANAARKFIAEAEPGVAAGVIYGAAFAETDLEHPNCPKMRALLQKCFSIVAENLGQFDEKSVRRIMAAYWKLKLPRPQLHDALWNHAVGWCAADMMLLMRLSLKKGTMKAANIDALGDFILANKEEFHNLTGRVSLTDVVDCSHFLAIQAAELPGTTERFEELGNVLAGALQRHDLLREDPDLLLRFVLNLTVLGVYPKQELDFLFSETFQKSSWVATTRPLQRLLDLERLVRLHFGEACPYAVLPELKEKAQAQVLPSLDKDLVQSVRSALGGEEFLLENAVTPSGIQVELAAVIRDGRFAVAVSGKPSPFKDLPANCKVIAILECLPGRDIDSTIKKRRLKFALKERFLRAEGIFPIHFVMSTWRNLLPHERVPYLRRRLKEVSCRVETERKE